MINSKIIILGILTSVIIFSGISFPNTNYQTRNYSYNDVVLVINNNSQVSKDIGDYFKTQRNITHIIYINTIDGEDINISDFNSQIRFPIERSLISNNLTNSTNYIITTKGLPLKITDIKRSIDSELTLILGPF